MFIARQELKLRRGLEERNEVGLVLAMLISAPPNRAEGFLAERAINMPLLRSKELLGSQW